MAYSDIENKDCLCAWIASLGQFKDTLENLLTGAQTILQVMQAYYVMVPTDLSDEWDKITLQAELAYLEAKLDVIGAPLVAVSNYIEPWADCNPVSTLGRDLKEFKDTVFADILDRRYEIEQLLAALDDRTNKSATIDRWIETLETIKEAIEYCGEV